jgi:VIT1/CCC1 family predicted Fe2+/Mn2+ transporter
MSEATEARPWQAAVVSAASFAIGAGLPIVTMLAVAAGLRIGVIAVTSLVLLAVLGATGAYLGGAPAGRAALRVTVGGGLAMMVTALIGNLIGTGVG